MRFLLSLLPLLVLLFCSLNSASAARKYHPASNIVRSSCRHATYPKICLRTLSNYAGPAKTPRDLAQVAVNVSLARARRVSGFLAQLSASFKGTKLQRSAIGDCVDLMSSSVDELSETLAELHHLRKETFRFQMSNAQTWLSAALTDDETCLDGIQEANVKAKAADVKRKITNAARVYEQRAVPDQSPRQEPQTAQIWTLMMI